PGGEAPGGGAPGGGTTGGGTTGREYVLEADLVFDATGTYGLANALGSGGLPAPGERALDPLILRRLGDVHAFLETFRAGRVLLIGHGHSAAHALLALRDRCSRNPEVSVTWSFRSRNIRPFRETASDPLPGRDAVVSAANALAAAPPGFLDIRRAASVASLEKAGPRIRVRFASGSAVEADAIVSLTGYRPDLSFLSELALDLSPATQGTRRLHAVFSGATDCLAVPMPAAADLDSGEAGFYLLGAKSYGRSGAFLLRDGILHMEMILKHAVG
ncbi:MAG: flavoprotein, partial [Fibrobacteres bacterium]|nr:flavoprotein [Fibrobacterota bacterium]